jgi:ribonuclease Z
MKMVRIVGLIVLALIVALGAGALIFRKTLAAAVFERVIADTVGRDRTADLPDGLHVYLCGTGSPMPDPARAGPCVGVLAGKKAFLFDIGSGGARRLARMGFPVGRLERIYLTHLHSDHFDGMGEILLQAWVGGSRRSPLPVAGPLGVVDVVSGFNAAYRIDSGYRTAHHGPAVADPSGFGGVGEVIATPEGEGRIVLDEDGVRITAIRVAHEPIDPAFGYRIDYGGRSVILSGDTVYSPSLVRAATGADLLLHEALQPTMVRTMSEAAASSGQANLAKVLSDIQDYHATPEDAARSAKEAGVRALVFYHIVPPLPTSLLYPLFLGDAPSAFDGRIIVGEDGLRLSLPAGSDKILESRIR